MLAEYEEEVHEAGPLVLPFALFNVEHITGVLLPEILQCGPVELQDEMDQFAPLANSVTLANLQMAFDALTPSMDKLSLHP